MKSMYVKIGILVLIAGLLSACGSQSNAAPTSAPTEAIQATEAPATQPASQGTTVSFMKDVLPIIESRCINCHGGDRTEKGLSLKTYDTLGQSRRVEQLKAFNTKDTTVRKKPKTTPSCTPWQRPAGVVSFEFDSFQVK